MSIYKNISIPDSLDNLLAVLKSAPPNSRYLAGGTDILLELQQNIKPSADLMVDLTSIPEMRILEERENHFYIGAAVPLSEIASSALTKKNVQALLEACRLIGGPQVRNVATLGGNVAHALPAADGSIALLCLDAMVEVLSPEGSAQKPLVDLFLGPAKTTLKWPEVILGFWITKPTKNQASCFKRIMRPQGVALPILNLAIWLERNNDKISKIRIAVGPGGPVPTRAYNAEQFLVGKTPDAATLDEAACVLLDCVKFRTSAMRATSEYRQHLCSQLFKDVLLDAWNRTSMD